MTVSHKNTLLITEVDYFVSFVLFVDYGFFMFNVA